MQDLSKGGSRNSGGGGNAASEVPKTFSYLFGFAQAVIIVLYFSFTNYDYNPNDRAYVMGFGLNKYLCARDRLHVLARYINDHADPSRHNVRFVKLWDERRADVVALRDIAAGEELFVSYGTNYWKVHGPLRGE